MILRVAHLFHEIFLVHAIHGESLPRSRLNRWKKKNSQDEESNGHLLSLSLSHQLVLPRTFSLTIFLLFPATRFPSAARFSWSSSFYVPPSRSPNCPSLFRSRRSTFSLSLLVPFPPPHIPSRWILLPARTVVNISPRGWSPALTYCATWRAVRSRTTRPLCAFAISRAARKGRLPRIACTGVPWKLRFRWGRTAIKSLLPPRPMTEEGEFSQTCRNLSFQDFFRQDFADFSKLFEDFNFEDFWNMRCLLESSHRKERLQRFSKSLLKRSRKGFRRFLKYLFFLEWLNS